MILLGVEVDVASQVGVQDIPPWLSIANAIFVAIFVCLGFSNGTVRGVQPVSLGEDRILPMNLRYLFTPRRYEGGI